MFTISAEAAFDSAHFLSGYPGKCARLHGHRWRVVAEVSAQELNDDGMVMDFKVLKKALQNITGRYDHCVLAEENTLQPATLRAFEQENFKVVTLPFRPTAEYLAKQFYDELRLADIPVTRVSVYETPDNKATYEV